MALRSMKAPGTAYNDPMLGKDPQPDNMSKYVHTSQDNGGVHLNSGIPNKAFYLASVGLGGYSWEKAGKIWYNALTTKFKSTTGFQDAANLTVQAALELFSVVEASIVSQAWAGVGIKSATPIPGGGNGGPPPPPPPPSGSLKAQIDAIFAYFEGQVANDPELLKFIVMAHALFDNLFPTIAPYATMTAAANVSALQVIVDGIFAAMIIAQKGHPAKIMALKMVKLLFDEYFKTHPVLP